MQGSNVDLINNISRDVQTGCTGYIYIYIYIEAVRMMEKSEYLTVY